MCVGVYIRVYTKGIYIYTLICAIKGKEEEYKLIR